MARLGFENSLGDRLTVGQRPLKPLIGVRFPIPQFEQREKGYRESNRSGGRGEAFVSPCRKLFKTVGFESAAKRAVTFPIPQQPSVERGRAEVSRPKRRKIQDSEEFATKDRASSKRKI